MSAKRGWKATKSPLPLVGWVTRTPATAPKRPSEAAKTGSGQRTKGWEFDFSTETQPKKVESFVTNVQDDDDDDDDDDDIDVIPPTQDIDDDDDDDDDNHGGPNSAGTSPILSAVPEPSFKRLKLTTDENRYLMAMKLY